MAIIEQNTSLNSNLIDVIVTIKTSKLIFAINYTIPSILTNITYNKLYILTKKDNFNVLYDAFQNNLICIDEDAVCQGLNINVLEHYFLNKNAKTNRVGWYFQQFLKLGIAKQDYILDSYLIWDADAIVLKPLTFISSDNKILYDTNKEHHPPYFSIIKKLIGIEKQVEYSFITEHFIFKKNIVLNLLNAFSENHQEWWYYILDNVDDDCLSYSGFSEYELYGNYVIKNYPNTYQIRKLSKYRNGAKLFGHTPNKISLNLFSLVFDYMSFEEWQSKQKILLVRSIKIFSVFIKALFNKLRR